jgi:starch synthase
MLPRDEVIQLLSHATVFVCPSTYEPFGLINVEAMACAVPVVATAVGGIPEIVVDGVTGYLVPLPDDLDLLGGELAERVNGLLGDRSAASAMGEAGRDRVREHFTWQAIAARTVELYAALIGAG